MLGSAAGMTEDAATTPRNRASAARRAGSAVHLPQAKDGLITTSSPTCQRVTPSPPLPRSGRRRSPAPRGCLAGPLTWSRGHK